MSDARTVIKMERIKSESKGRLKYPDSNVGTIQLSLLTSFKNINMVAPMTYDPMVSSSGVSGVISAPLPSALSARACARACLVTSFMALAQEVFVI